MYLSTSTYLYVATRHTVLPAISQYSSRATARGSSIWRYKVTIYLLQKNPLYSLVYCKRQTDDAVDQLREATEAARKAQAESDATHGDARPSCMYDHTYNII